MSVKCFILFELPQILRFLSYCQCPVWIERTCLYINLLDKITNLLMDEWICYFDWKVWWKTHINSSVGIKVSEMNENTFPVTLWLRWGIVVIIIFGLRRTYAEIDCSHSSSFGSIWLEIKVLLISIRCLPLFKNISHTLAW